MVVAIAKNATGLPLAKVVWIDHTNHYAFRPHEADVIREINTFIAGLLLQKHRESAELSSPKRDRSRNVASELSPFQAVG